MGVRGWLCKEAESFELREPERVYNSDEIAQGKLYLVLDEAKKQLVPARKKLASVIEVTDPLTALMTSMWAYEKHVIEKHRMSAYVFASIDCVNY